MNLENQNFVGKSADEKDDHIFQCHDEIRELKAENERLREAFNLYASHNRNDDDGLCDKLKHSDWPCTCGYEEARQALNADGGE